MRIITSAEVYDYLQQAGQILAHLPESGWPLGMGRSTVFDRAPPDVQLAYGYNSVMLNTVVPSAQEISLMDQVCGWLGLVPDNLRRGIVATRMIWNPRLDHPAVSYARIGRRLGFSGPTVKKLEDRGVWVIARELNRQPRRLRGLPDYA